MFNKIKFLEKYQKTPIIEYQNNTNSKPLVSVCIQTYKHAPFIAQCLDGALMQKTNFEFEILIGEDESDDGTREICIEYAKKHPDKIRLFLHSRKNNIKVYGKPTGHFNYKYNLYSARGKYIAFCDGDDFWIDPLKLQKQADFLEVNDDYGMIYSDKQIEGENKTEKTSDTTRLERIEKRFTWVREKYKSGNIFWDLLDKNLINTLTICTRSELILDYINKFHKEEFAYDYRLWLHIASYSKIKFVNEQWGTYRVIDQGISNTSGFFNKRLPLVKQSALTNYLSEINYDRNQIDRKIYSKTINHILRSPHLSKTEKRPTTNLLKRRPIFFIYLLNWHFARVWRRVTRTKSKSIIY